MKASSLLFELDVIKADHHDGSAGDLQLVSRQLLRLLLIAPPQSRHVIHAETGLLGPHERATRRVSGDKHTRQLI